MWYKYREERAFRLGRDKKKQAQFPSEWKMRAG